MPVRKLVSLSFLFVLVGACAGSDDDRPTERLRNSFAVVDESLMRASVVDDDLEVSVPLEILRSGGMLPGRLSVEMVDVAQGAPVPGASGSVEFTQTETTEWHVVRLEGAGGDLERVETAPKILHWRFDFSRDDLYGRRSLWAALNNLVVQLRGPSELPAEGTSPIRVVVRDPRTGSSIAGAEVAAVLEVPGVEEGDEAVVHDLFEGLTDERGELLAEVGLPEGVSGGTIRVSVTHDGGQVWTSRSVARRADSQLYIGTDKTLYKPGQEVSLRLLALGGADRRPVVDGEVVFEAKDGKGNKVFRRRTRTDAFGVAAAKVPVDTRVNEGDWSFAAYVDGRQTEIVVPVERYELPKIRVDVATERDFALPGDGVRGRVNAAYLFGEPVVGGSVTVEARTATGIFVGNDFGATDDDGWFGFEFDVPEAVRSASLEENGDTLLVSATVTDSADQTEHGEGRLALAAAPLRIQLVAEPIAVGTESPAWVVVTDPLGRPLVADVEVSGGGVRDDSVETNSSGVAALRLAPAGPVVDLEVMAVDGAGRTHTRAFQLGASDEARLTVRSDRSVYQPGDRAVLHVSAATDVERVYMDAYRGAEGVLSTAVDLRDGEAEVELPITEDLGGLLVVDALGIAADGRALRGSRPLLVERDDRLNVTVAADRETYAPGDEARLDVVVSDGSGSGRVASVGLAVVDEAVFALGGEPRTSIQRAFGLDERILPRTVNVAGRDADDLLGLPDPTDREELARLLFASAGDVRAPNFDYNSLADDLPRVRDSLAGKLGFDAERIVDWLAGPVESGLIDADGVRSVVRRIRWSDPFGRQYRLSVEGASEWSLELVLWSDGPDEVRDTADDVTARVSMSRLFPDERVGMAGDGDWDEDWAGADGDVDMDVDSDADFPEEEPGGGGEGIRVRSDFRETVYVNPTLVTDASGRASVTVPLADSITTWRATADGSTSDGRIGGARHRFRTFQSFFVDFTVPTNLTRGDVVELPAVVYNYLAEPKSVTVAVDEADWFVLESGRMQVVDLGPSEVRAARFRLTVTRAGTHALTLRAWTDEVDDGLVRMIDVSPDGQPEDESISGQLEDSDGHAVHVPGDAVEGGTSVEIVLTPGFASEAVQGLESLLQEPNGCFEQTTSTAWPNTLVADYLDRTGQLTAERREELVGLVTRGYQRLLTFESPTRGFNWWGDADPGNRILSAIMLWHLADLESLIEIDEAVRDRTLAWLVEQQQADGSWEAGDALHAGNEVLGTSEARTTAFIAWALAHTGWADDAVDRAIGFLRGHVPPASDLYANALAANAFALTDPDGRTAADLFARLDDAKETRDEGAILWPSDTPSWTGAGGDTAALETTGLVAYALLNADAYPDDAAGAMRFILANKDSVGTWYNTQATVNALRALSAGVAGRGSDAVGTLVVTVNGEVALEIEVDEDNSDLLRRFDITDLVGVGENDVQLDFVGTGKVSYRLTRRAYRPVLPGARGPLSMTLDYDTTRTTVGTPVTATVNATYDGEGARDQVIVRVGRAPGFQPRREDLDQLVADGLVSRWETRTDDVTFYLMGMAGGETRELTFRLTPGLEVDATAPASTIYAYYEPTLREVVDPVRFVVEAP